MATPPLPRIASISPPLPILRPRCLRLVIASTGPRDVSWAQALVVRLCKDPAVELRAIVDDVVPRLSQTIMVLQNRSTSAVAGGGKAVVVGDDVEFYRQQAFELADWADLLVLAPLDADGIAKMLAGVADTLLLEVLRGWDPAKKVLLVPGMSTHAWRGALTKRHLAEVRREWPWIRTLSPILWHWEGGVSNHPHGAPHKIVNWSGFNEMLQTIRSQAQLLGLGREMDVTARAAAGGGGGGGGGPHDCRVHQTRLPPEIWTVILEYVNDWELARALGIYANIPMPDSWTLEPRNPSDPLKVYRHELEWTVLTCSSAAICRKISQSPPGFLDLTVLIVRLVIQFALVDVLVYLESNRPDLLAALDGEVIPTTASAFLARIPVLDFWRTSRWFRGRHVYDDEAVDGASMNGHVDVLDWWWRRSGLPMRYSEAALEQASGNGHVLVLEWWRDAAAQDEKVVLRPGRSLLAAAQHGRVDVLRWWEGSGTPVGHSDGVAKMASRWGQVGVLELWRTLKGDDKLAFDEDVLVGPTVHAHIDVLEWWKKFARGQLPGMAGRGQRVEYRTCDIEEALEDSIGNQEGVRAWWKENGLNLGLRNMEWMKTRSL